MQALSIEVESDSLAICTWQPRSAKQLTTALRLPNTETQATATVSLTTTCSLVSSAGTTEVASAAFIGVARASIGSACLWQREN